MLDEIRYLDEKQRTTALDVAAVLLPRTLRFYAAVSILTLGRDQAIADAVRQLALTIGELTDVAVARQQKYEEVRGRANKALGEFRAVADRRNR
jgi:hypothetical protein